MEKGNAADGGTQSATPSGTTTERGTTSPPAPSDSAPAGTGTPPGASSPAPALGAPASGPSPAADTTTQAGPGTGTGTAPASPPAPTGTPGESSPGGGSSGPTRTREILHQGPHVERHRTGTILILDGQGGATFVDGLNQTRLEGNEWVDPKTGQRAERGLWAKADHQLRDLEMRRGLRRTMMP